MLRIGLIFLVVLVCAMVAAQEPPADKRMPKDSSKLGKIELEKELEQLKERLNQLFEKLPTKEEMQKLQEQIEEVQKQLREIKIELEGPKGATLAKVEAAAEKAQREANWASWIVMGFLTVAVVVLAFYGYIAWRGRGETVRAAGEAKEHAESAREIVEKQIPEFMEKAEKEHEGFIEECREKVEGLIKRGEGKIREFVEERKKIVREEIQAEGKRQREVSELSTKALRLYEQKKYDEAIDVWNEVIAIDPENAGAFNNRGNAKDDKGDHEGAISDHSKAISIFEKTGDKKKTANAYNNRGYTFAKGLKEFTKAVEDCNKAIKLNPSNSFAYASRGYAYAGLEKFEKAITDSEKALELDDKVAGSWHDYACALAFMKKKDKMLEKLQKAIELDSKYKEMARKDEDFKEYWGDEDFKKLVGK